MEIPQTLLDRFKSRNSILFLGAGISIGAGLPGWVDLMRPLAAALDYTLPENNKLITTDHVLNVAQFYENKYGRIRLIKYLQEKLDSSNIQLTAVHKALPLLHVPVVLTTNYDTLLERSYKQHAFQEKSALPNVTFGEDGLPFWTHDRVQIVKLCGDIQVPDSIIVTKYDFNVYSSIRPRVIQRLTTLLESYTPVFIGYSLQDPFFNQIWDRIGLDFGEQRVKGYAILFDSSSLELDNLEHRCIQPIVQDVKNNDRTGTLAEWLMQLSQLIVTK